MTPREKLVDLHEQDILSVAETPHQLYQALQKKNIRMALDGHDRQDIPYAIGRDIEAIAEKDDVRVFFVIINED